MEDTDSSERRPPQPRDPRNPAFEIPDEIVCDLKKPFKRVATDAEMITRIAFRPPTVGEMKKVTKRIEKDGEASGAILLMTLANADNLTEPDIERINFVDFQLCLEKLQPFLELAKPSPA